MIEINQRGERDWAIYMGGEYRGTVSRIGDEFVCTHTREHFVDREAAIQFLISH